MKSQKPKDREIYLEIEMQQKLEFKREDKIGSGAFGTVFKLQLKNK